jgi:hypothetical protein
MFVQRLVRKEMEGSSASVRDLELQQVEVYHFQLEMVTVQEGLLRFEVVEVVV